jgi:DNA-binding transcriptional MerR regulator
MLLVNKYLISDLADLAGVSPRTIRYYTEEGLLPQPEVDGKYAYYTQAHLSRLNLIKLLKDNYLPLKEIRQVLLGMTDKEIEAKVGDPASISGIVQERASLDPRILGGTQRTMEETSALDYISKVLGEQAPARNRPEPNLPTIRPTFILGPEVQKRTVGINNQSMMFQGDVEQWEKFILADGVELFIRQPADKRTLFSVHQLVGLARKLFS